MTEAKLLLKKQRARKDVTDILQLLKYYCKLNFIFRDIAQPGRALALGARCHWFESSCPDQRKKLTLVVSFLFVAGSGFEPVRNWFDYKAKADGKTPVGKADCRSERSESEVMIPVNDSI